MLEIILILTGLFGLYLFLKGLARMRRGQRIRGGMQTGTGMLTLALAALAFGIASHLYTYHRLTAEQNVAALHFEQHGPQTYTAHLEYTDGRQEHMELKGDEWLIEARVLKWRGIANLVGMDAVYRLERLRGQYHDIAQERAQTPSVYPLTQEAGVDLWRIAREYRFVPFVDALYGSAAYMPMADNSRFQVTLTQSGLIVRPVNPQAEEAIKQWH